MSGKNLKISILCYFFIAIVLDGLQRLSGLFILELLQSTRVNRQMAFVPYIFSWLVSNIIASFSDIVIDNKKSEYIILFGVLLSAAGAALCVLATNITTLTIFWGLIFGSGHGLASPHLFKRLKNADCTKLSFILQVTPSLGVVIIPFAQSALNSYYGLQGSCLIFCGLILNYLPLALAASYNIQICIPNIKWRVRKKSKRYFVSKQDEGNIVSIESFINSLEPDLILKICQNDEFLDEKMRSKSELSTNVARMPIGRKRSETRGNDLQGLEIDRFFPRNKTHSQMFVEIKNYEKGRKIFECSFNNKDVVHDGMECMTSKADTNVNFNIINTIKLVEENSLSKNTESESHLKNKILRTVSECEINRTLDGNKESMKSLENYAGDNTACVVIANTTMYNLDLNEDGNAFQTNEICGNETISSKTQPKENPYYDSSKKFQEIKSLKKENILMSSHLEHKLASNMPLDIKVHVEEYIFNTDENNWEDNFYSKYLTAEKNRNRNQSNSLLNATHKNLDLYSISENSEHGSNRNISEGEKYIQKSSNTEDNGMFYFLKRIFSSRVCLCILLIKMIFEINLVTLLTIFADLGSDMDNQVSDFKWILVAFGAGGLIGKFCCCKISRTIPEKCHTIGLVLFLLNGLSIAGVLYSLNLNWLAGFYCILGALEGGITHIIPKFILEYVDKDMHSTLSSVKIFLSGVAIICIPYAIGLFRDEMGEYEFLLQTLSYSSVLCAFLAYFLPLRAPSNKRTNPVFRRKMETVRPTRTL